MTSPVMCTMCIQTPRYAHFHIGAKGVRAFVACSNCKDKVVKECAARGCLWMTKGGGSEKRPLGKLS